MPQSTNSATAAAVLLAALACYGTFRSRRCHGILDAAPALAPDLERERWPPAEGVRALRAATRPRLFGLLAESPTASAGLAKLPCIRGWNASRLVHHPDSATLSLRAWTQPSASAAEFVLARGRESDYRRSQGVRAVNFTLAEFWRRSEEERNTVSPRSGIRSLRYHSGPLADWGSALEAEAAGMLTALSVWVSELSPACAYWCRGGLAGGGGSGPRASALAGPARFARWSQTGPASPSRFALTGVCVCVCARVRVWLCPCGCCGYALVAMCHMCAMSQDAPSDVVRGQWPPSSGPVVWMGSAGVIAAPHYDKSHNLVLQVFGTKRWLLWAPSQLEALQLHPAAHPSRRQARMPLSGPASAVYSSTRAHVVDAQPGDLLYVP